MMFMIFARLLPYCGERGLLGIVQIAAPAIAFTA
jgi:hypothetical protein